MKKIKNYQRLSELPCKQNKNNNNNNNNNNNTKTNHFFKFEKKCRVQVWILRLSDHFHVRATTSSYWLNRSAIKSLES